ncbi:TonB-dependent receptor [Agriterribacter sp.]|uniref:TonB-dependent receptor n=1 Tax=Agriterribacter sp. TaxID=2821509 RepID=UPI002C4834E6|nr:TonB-dependent receptor [Agriterribacter sp.]HRP57144.1 TonB-dependent receptor [Agriterribacter sp.]
MRNLRTTYCFVKGFLLFCSLPCIYTANAQTIGVGIHIVNNMQIPVSNATVEINGRRVLADSSGKLRQVLTKGNYLMEASAVGYYSRLLHINLLSDTTINIMLIQKENELSNVVVTAEKSSSQNEMGFYSLNIDELKKLPVILGETDPLKTITLLPGVKSGGEAGSGIYVRGGGPDQNLVLLDDIPVYNPNHLLGFFSVFNGEAIKSVSVKKGDMNAAYGGRLSSVISIDTREGDKDSLKISGGIGLISSKLSIEGPLVKSKASFIISGRRTYIDQVAKVFAKKKIGNNGYYFYDINAKAGYEISHNNKLLFTFYNGQDKFSYTDDKNNLFNADWGNSIAGLTWKQQMLRGKLKQSFSMVYNAFNLDSYYGYDLSDYVFTSAVNDYQVKNDWNYSPSRKLSFNWGFQYIWHRFKPGAGDITKGIQEFKTKINNQFAREAAVYLSSNFRISRRLSATTGLRYSYFNQVGPTERVIYDNNGNPTGETESYRKGESIARYQYPEPRLNLDYRISSLSSIKLSYTKTIQYLHLATTSGATFPSDVWIPAGQIVQPGIAQQVSIGYFRSTLNNMYQFNLEAYYKKLHNQIEFKQGAQLLLNQNIEGEMMFGQGKAYGIELYAEKKKGKLTGWVGYTLSKTQRKYAEMNNGKPFPYRYDRTHDLSIVGNYTLSGQWNFSTVFVFGTGNALTMPTGRVNYNVGYNVSQRTASFTSMNQYEEINNYRLPSYHRLDICATYTPRTKKKKRFSSSWNFNIYNVYNRQNPYFIYMDIDQSERSLQGKMVYLFPITPAIGWNFKF